VLVVAAAAGLGSLVVTGRLADRPAPAQASGVGGPSVVAGARPTPPASTSAAERALVAPPAPPAALLIPAIDVRAEVESVGMDAQGRMATPSRPDHVAWFSPGVVPGAAGDAVIDGHLDWTNGQAVFWNLHKLRPGDEIRVVKTDGSGVRFLVDSTTTVAYDGRMDQLFTRTGPPALSLVTCSGPWDRRRGTYLDRLLVHAALAPTSPLETPGDEGG
jgi:hypothetical protein